MIAQSCMSLGAGRRLWLIGVICWGRKQLNNIIQIMQLGQEVLDKISDLLVEIDKPRSPRRRPRHSHIDQPEDTDPINDNRLYENYKVIKKRAHEREKQQIRGEMAKLNQFRVDNKHSIFLNSRNNLRPIHERTPDILRDKELSLERKRTEVNIQRERKRQIKEEEERQEMENYNKYLKSRSKSLKKTVSKKQLQEIVKRLSQRERERNEKANREKMEYLKQKLMNNREKPHLSKNTERLWEKRRQQHELSTNVFERFDKYVWDHKKHQEDYINSIREKETPFKPKISKNSIEILNKSSSSRVELHKQFERSHSQRCLPKHQHQKSLHLNPQHAISTAKKHRISTEHSRSQVNLSPYR